MRLSVGDFLFVPIRLALVLNIKAQRYVRKKENKEK